MFALSETGPGGHEKMPEKSAVTGLSESGETNPQVFCRYSNTSVVLFWQVVDEDA
jgi:hypothetical protein